MSFFDIPVEVLLDNIFVRLQYRDLLACLQTSKTLYHLLNLSDLLNYSRELCIAGLIENPTYRCENIPISQRLRLLREREEHWTNLAFTYKRTIKVPPSAAQAAPRLSGNTLILGFGDDEDAPSRYQEISTIELSNDAIEVEPKLLRPEADIVAFEFIPEHDLLVLVTCTDDDIEADIAHVQCHLLQNSTRDPHPFAANSTFEVGKHRESPLEIPNVNIAFGGDYLAISVCSENDNQGYFKICDWKNGSMGDEVFVSAYHLGLAFIREDLLLASMPHEMAFNVYHIPTDNKPPQLVSIIHVPKLLHEKPFTKRFLISAPNSGNFSYSSFSSTITPPFINDPSAGIITAKIYVYCPWETHTSFFMLVTHHRTILKLVLPDLESNITDHNITEIQWEEWGPTHARFLPLDRDVTDYPIATSGTRCLKIMNGALEVLDFSKIKTCMKGTYYSGNTTVPETTVTLMNSINSRVMVKLINEPTESNTQNRLFDSTTSLPYISTTYKDIDVQGSVDRLVSLGLESFLMDENYIIGVETEGWDLDRLHVYLI